MEFSLTVLPVISFSCGYPWCLELLDVSWVQICATICNGIQPLKSSCFTLFVHQLLLFPPTCNCAKGVAVPVPPWNVWLNVHWAAG